MAVPNLQNGHPLSTRYGGFPGLDKGENSENALGILVSTQQTEKSLVIVGSSPYQFERVEGWGRGRDGRVMGVNSGIAVDTADRVYVVDREPDPAIVVFDRKGRYLTSWGEDLFSCHTKSGSLLTTAYLFRIAAITACVSAQPMGRCFRPLEPRANAVHRASHSICLRGRSRLTPVKFS